MKINNTNLIRIIIIAISIVVVLFLFFNDFAWLGKVCFQTDFKKFTPFVSILVPQERTNIKNLVNIKQEPVYFDVYLPRDFEQINLQFEYFNQDNNLLEVGMQVNENNWDLKPLENTIINRIDWPKIEDNGLILFQRENNFEFIEQFFQQMPAIEKIAVYNYDLIYDYELADYQATNKTQEIDNQLMGAYQFYTYIKEEDLFFEFKFKTRNIKEATVYVYDLQDNLIADFSLASNLITAKLENLPEGVYKLELQTSADAITETITTKQQYISFVDSLTVIKPSQLVTNSQDLTFITYTNPGIQEISINDKQLMIEDIWQQYKIKPEAEISTIKIPNGNVEFTGAGLFAFSSKQFFNPLPAKIATDFNMINSGIDYILTYYNLPITRDSFKISNIGFDLTNEQINQGVVRFVISIPNLVNVNKGIYIKNLNGQLVRPSFWQENIKDNLIKYLKFYKNEIIK
ncbi:hypothetical protein ACFL2U_01900 [Patescibacteria group bacterium]